MGLFGDIFDFVTSPYQAVGGLASDIISGRNVFDSAAAAGGRVAGASVRDLSISASLASPVLGDSSVNKLTFGLSGDAVRAGTLNLRQQKGERLSGSEGLDLALTSGKLGGAAIGGYAAAGAFGGATVGGQALAGYAGAKGAASLLSGDVAGAFEVAQGLAPGLGLPQGIAEAAGAAKQIFDASGIGRSPGGSSAPTVSEAASSGGFGGAAPGGHGATLAVLGLVAVAAYFALKGRR